METELLSARDLAQRLACSIATVHRHSANGILPPPVRVGRLRRWKWGAVLTHLADRQGDRERRADA